MPFGLFAFDTLFSSNATSHWSLKVRQPLGHQRQALSLDAIDTHPALPLVPEEAGRFKHLKMPSRGLPCMRKDRRDLSGGHRASVEIDREQHAAPSTVRQGPEYRLIGVWTHPRSRLEHQQYSSRRVNVR
jgi:hypothetical protein